MILKKFLPILAFVLLLIPYPTFANSMPDTTAPKILAVDMLDTSVSTGESFKFKVKTTDDFSGISSISARFTSPSGSHSVHSNIRITKQSADEYYTLTSNPLNSFAEEGIWYLSSLSISDHAENYTHKSYGYDYYLDDPIATIEVVNNQKDTTAPKILAVDMLDTSVSTGESFKFKVKTTDDFSGISSISARFTSPSGSHSVHSNIRITKQSADGYYTLTSNPLNSFAEEGIWYLSSLSISDHAENYTHKSYGYDYYLDDPIATIEVVNNQKDTTAPKILAVNMLDTSVSTGESFKFKVKTTDDLSGISSISARFTSPSGSHSVHSNIRITKQSADGYYTLTSNPLNSFAEEGIWYLSSLSISDHAENYTHKSYGYDYYLDDPIATIKVQSNQIVDTIPPVLHFVQILDSKVSYGDKVRFKIKAVDNTSSLEQIQLTLKSVNSSKTFKVNSMIDKVTANHEYILVTEVLDESFTQGDWYISNVLINDQQQNKFEKSYTFANSLGYFTLLPHNDNWNPKYNVALDKEWTITFSLAFDLKTIINNNIYITDPSGVKIPLKFIIDRGTNGISSQVTVSPLYPYAANTTYTLWIKDILSLDGKVLNKNVKMKFTTID